jgi:hypothetical protein
LTQRAAERLQIRTAPVGTLRASAGARALMTIPFSALLYDASGNTWTYTNPESLTFVRVRVTVERVDRSTAILSRGPAFGTRVVIVGAPELLGTETGVGE